MSITAPITIDSILDLANRLPRRDQAELIARLARTLAVAPMDSQRSPEEVQAAWNNLRADLSARPAGKTSMAEQLDTDRQDRDRMLQGLSVD